MEKGGSVKISDKKGAFCVAKTYNSYRKFPLLTFDGSTKQIV